MFFKCEVNIFEELLFIIFLEKHIGYHIFKTSVSITLTIGSIWATWKHAYSLLSSFETFISKMSDISGWWELLLKHHTLLFAHPLTILHRFITSNLLEQLQLLVYLLIKKASFLMHILKFMIRVNVHANLGVSTISLDIRVSS